MKKQALNPYLPSWEYVPDGEPYVFNGRVYVYGSHDFYNGYVFCMGDYVCWSAPVDDLGNWRYEGTIYRKTDDPLNPDGKMCLYAPDVTVGPDGRYYLYYVLDKVSIVSVAVCDTPAGKYEFLGYVHDKNGVRLGERETDEPQFDPGVLTEGDKTYLYTGACASGDKSRTGAFVTVLGSDMLTIEEEPVRVVPGCEYSEGTGFEGHAFFEASSIRKRGNTYYFIYSSEVMHELCYAVSDNPVSGFTYQGVIVSNCDLGIDSYKKADRPVAYGANNHGSMVQIGEDWYIFYHRHTNGSWYSRQGCAELLEIDDKGNIKQAEITSCGLNGGPLRGEGEYPAYLACHLYTDKESVYVGVMNSQKLCRMAEMAMKKLGILVIFKIQLRQDLNILIYKELGEFALQQEDMQMAILRCEMKLMGKCLRNYTLFIQMYGKIMKRKFQYRMVYSHCTLLFVVREMQV